MKAVKSNSFRKEAPGNSNPRAFPALHRRKINPVSPPTEVELRGIRVHFPFRPYKCQETYMGKVLDALLRSENALLESPTGTGKTLCLLCATLAWQRQQSRLLGQTSELNGSLSKGHLTASSQDGPNKAARVPTIIYASRTHSQLSQVARELRNTRYRPNHAILGSREQMCVNPKVKRKTSSASDINHDCNRLAKERKCRFRNNLEGFVQPSNETCGSAFQPVMDMEDLVDLGKTRKVCPFYLTRSQVEKAEILFVPYNYLFDKDARNTTLADIPWDNAVVIFDEAHNLESFASESASFDLSNTDIGGCISEVQRAMNYCQVMPDLTYNVKVENLVRVKAIFLKFEVYINSLSDKTAYAGEFMMEIFQKGAGINHRNHEIFIEEIRKINDLIMDMRGTGGGAPKLEHFVQCLKHVFGYAQECQCLAKAGSYRVHISPKLPCNNNNQSSGRTISYWCFAPALAMQDLENLKVRSVIVTSGTLSPLPSYSLELGLAFSHTLENPHIVGDNQIHVRVVGKGVSGKLLSSSYERRKDAEYFVELGNTLVSLAKVTPAGMLVFFPSYGVMETSLERWGGPTSSRSSNNKGKNNYFAAKKRKQVASNQYSFPFSPISHYNSNKTPWKRLLATKAVVVEPKSSADLSDAMSEFKRFLGLPNSTGCILMGVCRGKISEGIDFSHDMSRAVVITGLPFPPYLDPKVKLKREYLDGARADGKITARIDAGFDGNKAAASSTKLSGSEWYTQQAHRAVNQAIGRVIRNRSDYGAVLLLDSRFDQTRNQEGLSKWLRPHIQKDEGFGIAISRLAKFYKGAGLDAKKREEENAKLAASSVVLKYEEDEKFGPAGSENFTKVAFVKKPPNEVDNKKIPAKDALAALEEDSSMNAFVAPEQVIARLDVKKMQDKPNSVTPVLTTKREELLQSNHSKYDAVFHGGVPVAQGNTKEIAAAFMKKIQTKLSLTEQSAVRKAIVAMKKTGDSISKQKHVASEDKKPYLRLARDVLKLIIKNEQFEDTTNEGGNRMIFLFFRLLPCLLRVDVETMALKLVFEGSRLGGLCKENLAPENFVRVRRSTASILHSLWCCLKDSELTNASYLRQAEDVLRILATADRTAFTCMVKAYTKLIPARFTTITKSLCDELTMSKNVTRMKELERSKTGEQSIDPARFKLAKAPALVEQGGNRPKKGIADKQVSNPKVGQSVKRQRDEISGGKRFNPYAKKPSVACTQPKVSLRKDKPSLSSYIKSVESDTFVKRSAEDVMNSINANVPKNLVCPICSAPPKQPLVAKCGHISCLQCWTTWLKRSKTCPTCRASTSGETLARVVYQSHPGAGVPATLSQLCGPAGGGREDPEESSEEELEIISN